MGLILRRTGLFLVMAAAMSAQESAPQKKLLFLTHSQGYVHDVVKRPAPYQLSFAENELTAIARERGYTAVCTKDCSVLTKDDLEKYDVVAFYTTGGLPAPAG